MSHCSKCGKELSNPAKFCPGCGAPIKAEPVANKSKKVPIKRDRKRRKIFGLSGWDFLAAVGAVISAAGWHYWTTLDPNANKDGFTALYITGFTGAVIFLRRPIDALLMPVHSIKKHVPRLVLIGVALALPYFLAHYFYKQGEQNYPLMHKSIVWGTILPYILLRIPQGASGGVDRMMRLAGSWMFFSLIVAVWLADAGYLLADDFATDYRRIEDGLRTDGYAEVIAGTVATAINVLVNGALIFQTSGGEGKEGEVPVQYTMDVRTEGRRTSLTAGLGDQLWIYAKILCSKPEVNTQSLTSAIEFDFSGECASWMAVTATATTGGFKAVQIVANPPGSGASASPGGNVTVDVSGQTADGQLMTAPVSLTLESAEIELIFF